MAHQQFQQCIDVCVACANACTHCATSCLNEQNVAHLKTCIQLDLECAVICRAAAEVMSLGSRFSAHMCRVCADACNACADECEKHAQMGMEHCRECADACRHCAATCEEMATPV
ncbi:four-helix bundle copper-binding protein [Dyadobacter pollutisoli]|uniref:Four-helix bundle copper-binding protein n=1 Tax=Dyadobacter pollutisoli TaxID=2910158 RepID=A0A9E8NDI9_9BACT|nr:four-helix bundle copper-binding protein [Dyadobacter pollutisoli]WAC12342.1 four-helix bundle copper-binding protein [Dyadobacter pollutisoli]